MVALPPSQVSLQWNVGWQQLCSAWEQGGTFCNVLVTPWLQNTTIVAVLAHCENSSYLTQWEMLWS